jgi:hypothetical protein
MRAFILALVALAGCSSPEPSPQVQRLLDESEIARVAVSIDDAVDRKNWSAARAFFADEIDVDFSTLGGEPSHIPADQLIDNWKATLPRGKPSFHLSGAPLITINGDTATLTARGYAWNMLPTRPAENNLWEVWGVYEEKMKRMPEGWRVTAFTFTKTYERGDPAIRTATADAVVPPSGMDQPPPPDP